MATVADCDFSRWAVVGFHDDSGLGRQAQDIKRLFGMRHLAVPTDRLTTHPLVPGVDTLLTPDMPEPQLVELLRELEGILVLEQWRWHPALFRAAKTANTKIVAYINWEWFNPAHEAWKLCDLFVCPSPFTLKIVQSFGFGPAVFLPWALDLQRFKQREIRGPARTFFHNAGIVDDDDRKGTRATVEAFMRVRRRDLRLIVRLQKPAALPPTDSRVEIRVGNLRDPADLYAEGEVAIQPSKMEGCGLQILEPVCIGIPVITTDYPPMSDHVRQAQLLAKKRWFKRSAFPARAAGISHAHLRLPSVGSLSRRIEWCAENELGGFSAENRRYGIATYGPEILRSAWSEALLRACGAGK